MIVELFTSQGCSSCPPADRVLSVLDAEQPLEGIEILALSEHVDYWNSLGWKDPFSDQRFSQRQQAYAARLGHKDVYTPQMIVQGRYDVLGSDWKKALREIDRAAKTLPEPAQVVVQQRGSRKAANVLTLALLVERMPQVTAGDVAQVWVAVTESGLQRQVSRGENTGRTLAHTGVVRNLSLAGDCKGGRYSGTFQTSLLPEWDLHQLRAVVFVQEKKSGRMLGAAALRLHD